MTGAVVRPRLAELKQLLEPALSVEFGPINPESACSLFKEAGYSVTSWLRAFIENYSEMTVVWRATRGGENEIVTTVEAALDAYPRNIRNYARRLGMEVVPVGMAFATEDRVLLAENGDVLLGSDAGLQRIANGFEESLRALLTNDWDKTFF